MTLNPTVKNPVLVVVLALIAGSLYIWMDQSKPKYPGPRAAAPPLYSRADFANNSELDPYANRLVTALTKVRKTAHFCKQNMDPSSVVINGPLSKFYHDTIFTVQCWTDEKNYTHTSFDLDGLLVSSRQY